MADYTAIKNLITDVVKTNGAQEITGANLQNVLVSMINAVASSNNEDFGRINGNILNLLNYVDTENEDIRNEMQELANRLDTNRYGYNVTVFGLVAGVHTLATAVKNVPPAERFGGQKITFKTDAGWVTYQNTSLSTDNYEDVVNWVLDSGVNVEGDVTITNNPDYEDLTQNNQNELKFADKEYNAATFSGLGRVYLRKNIVSNKNVLTQAMLSDANTIYIIQYDYDLNGASITIPANCVLGFEGGSLSNGTIVGNYTTIKASPIKIFGANMLFSGTWNIGATFVEWFDTENQADDFEKANSLGTTHLLIGKFYIFDRQVSVSNSVIGDGRIPSIISGGATAKNETSTIIYIGNGGETSVTPPAEAGDSILLIHDKNGIEIRNINFVTSTEANIDVPNLSVTSVFLDNPKFSAIKMTTEGVSLRENNISSCKFEELPIGVNIYDLSEGTIYRYEVNSDNNNIENCWFSNCGIGIQLYSTNAYNTILYKCIFYGAANTYRHINLLKGTFVSIEGYFGPLSSTIGGIKAAVYVENSHYYTMITPYAECHNGYFLYDNSNVGLADECNKALLNPVVKSSEIDAPAVDGHKVCVYLGGSDYNILNMYGGTFVLSAYVNQGILNLFGTNILLNVFRNSSNNAKVNKSFCPNGNTNLYSGQVDAVAETSILSVGGATNTSSCAQLIYDNKNKKMRLGLTGIGYIDATYSSGGSWIDFGPFGIYLEPRNINSQQRAKTIGGFVRNSDINANHFSLGVFDASQKLRDVFGNLVGTKYEGTTAQRPTGVHYGTSYFDTDLGKPIWWLVNGTYPNGTWVDATGTPV